MIFYISSGGICILFFGGYDHPMFFTAPKNFTNSCRIERWVLATRAYRVLSDVSDANVSQLELKVVWKLRNSRDQPFNRKISKKCRGQKKLHEDVDFKHEQKTTMLFIWTLFFKEGMYNMVNSTTTTNNRNDELYIYLYIFTLTYVWHTSSYGMHHFCFDGGTGTGLFSKHCRGIWVDYMGPCPDIIEHWDTASFVSRILIVEDDNMMISNWWWKRLVPPTDDCFMWTIGVYRL